MWAITPHRLPRDQIVLLPKAIHLSGVFLQSLHVEAHALMIPAIQEVAETFLVFSGERRILYRIPARSLSL
jgi:hypothetical protein